MIEVTVRVYGPLTDFVPAHRRQVPWTRLVDGHSSVKDLVESLGIPHPEIDLILVNGASVAFDHVVRSVPARAVALRAAAEAPGEAIEKLAESFEHRSCRRHRQVHGPSG